MRILRLSLITGIALNIGLYNTYVVDFLWKSPEALAGVISQVSLLPAPKAHYLDTIMSQYYDYASMYWASGSFTSTAGLGLITIAFLIFACGVLVTGYAAFLLVMAKITLALMISLGPIFILTAIFDATKQFFNSWVGQGLNAVFIPVLCAGVITLMLMVIQSGFSKIGSGSTVALTEPSLLLVMGLVIASLIGMLVLMQLPSISAALGGGLALSSLGGVGAAYNAIKRGATGGKNLLTGKTLNDARGARRQRESNKRWAQNNPGKASKIAGGPKALYRKVTTRKNRVAQG